MDTEELTIGNIFNKILEKRQKTLIDKVKKYMDEISDINEALDCYIRSEEKVCLSRGTETVAFDKHCRLIALLLKAQKAIIRQQNKISVNQ